ncbi:MAG: sensor histidine kinase N-terminal domain-containing protein [Zoogloeaceae bacterium]|nr:sensor histidine kinase N-terminal domain-containing protein [Zoogloeaceae bacterium]
MKNRNLQPHSLRQRLLAWLLPGVLLFLVASGTSAYFVASRNANEAYDRSLLNLAIALGNQVHARNGRPELELDQQGQQILVTDKFDHIYFAVYGPKGRLLGGSDGLFPAETPQLDMFSDGHYYFDKIVDGRNVRGVIQLLNREGHELTVLVGETLAKRESQVGSILLGILLPEALLLAATIIMILLAVNAGLRPLDTLRVQLSRRSPSDLSPVGAAQLPIELQPLATEVDRLLGRLDVALGAQRHFVSDAAHQLRTPIAALQAQVESIIQARNDPQLAPVLVAVRRLAHLVNQLLSLARAEPGGVLMAPVELRSLIEQNADAWVQLAIEHDVDLGFELQTATMEGSATLLRELIGNLVENAILYTPAGGQVTLRCASHDDGAATLAVEDNGPGIPAELRDRVFERFFRQEGLGGEGCGLGLAIVRQIANQHGATIRIAESESGGALLEVFFSRLAPCQGVAGGDSRSVSDSGQSPR